MNRIVTLSANDFRMVFRDPMLRIFLFLPLLILGVVVWVIPAVFSAYPVIQAYDYVILMWACMQASTMFGFISGFVFLEEKDENVFAALRVMPITAGTLVSVRMVVGVVIAFITNVAILSLTQWVALSMAQLLLVAFQYALLAPLLALLVATFAQNKVEGLAQFKIYNFLANVPILIYFLPLKALHATAVVPTYWTFRSIEAAQQGQNFFFFYGVGTLWYVVVLGILVRVFEKRVF